MIKFSRLVRQRGNKETMVTVFIRNNPAVTGILEAPVTLRRENTAVRTQGS